MTAPVPDVRAYGDFAGLESLKKSAHANDPAAIREVARQFESLFARMLIKSMRDAIGRDPIFGSDQEETYQSMFDDQLSLELTRGHGLGLADMLVRQLQRRGLAGSSSGSTPAHAGAGAGATGAGATGAGATGVSGASPSQGVPAASKTEQTSFIREVWPQAQQAGSTLGVDPTSLVAQAALETHWGRRVPRDASGRSSHNLFGVKASGDWTGPSVATATQEFQGGTARATTAAFRAYSSRTESFEDYVALLQNDPRYATALHTGSNVAAFAQALQQSGYATDPDYARKVSALASQVATAVGTLKFADAQPMSVETRTL
ncbi:MAG TPA: flagellar assembly peptidoglycan hydrolase FlgJ [Steroidobacteraceae bacterium]|nr:flagellar assembly peptidoglycan hydrolase FlgJ [Steroidobacteraceae bacterium]